MSYPQSRRNTSPDPNIATPLLSTLIQTYRETAKPSIPSLCTTVWCCRVLDPLQLQVISWKLQLVIGFGGEGTSRRFGDRLSSTEQKQKQEIKPFYCLLLDFIGKIRNKNLDYLGCSNPNCETKHRMWHLFGLLTLKEVELAVMSTAQSRVVLHCNSCYERGVFV